jgi:hypothetical protein
MATEAQLKYWSSLKIKMLGSNNHFYNKKHTKETREKIRLILKGRISNRKGCKHSEETKKRLSLIHKKLYIERPELLKNLVKINTGKKQSPETIEKRVSHFRGKKRPEWVVNKIRSKIMKGKDCHFWKGGVCKLSHRLREIPEYKKWRKQVFERDHYTCQKCYTKSGNGIRVELEAHHIIRFVDILKDNNIKTIKEAIDFPNLWDTNNGQTLCLKCHLKTDTYGTNNSSFKGGDNATKKKKQETTCENSLSSEVKC